MNSFYKLWDRLRHIDQDIVLADKIISISTKIVGAAVAVVGVVAVAVLNWEKSSEPPAPSKISSPANERQITGPMSSSRATGEIPTLYSEEIRMALSRY